ncbi:MAG: hypothetical protein Q7S96_04800 [bacterium]|nr:hypothetical protein [bacterium]
MEDGFEPIRALIRECLEYPGVTQDQIKELLHLKYATIVHGWLHRGTKHKRQKEWPGMQDKVQRYRDRLLRDLKRHGPLPEDCDRAWQEHCSAFLDRERMSAERFAEHCGVPDYQVRRWQRFGEVPGDRQRARVEELTVYAFEPRYILRAVECARMRFLSPLPRPLDDIGDRAVLAGVLRAIRDGAGLTTEIFAQQANVSKLRLDVLMSGAAAKARIHLRVENIADVLCGVAHYLTRTPYVEINALHDNGCARALEMIRNRPTMPKAWQIIPRGRVAWVRISQFLGEGTHPNLRYRSTQGERLAILLVRFCIAYEQSGETPVTVAQHSDLTQNSIMSWIRGRVLPGPQQIEALHKAIAWLEDEDKSASPVANALTEALPRAHAAEIGGPPARVDDAVEVPDDHTPTDGAYDILVGIASIMRGLKQMSRAGWKPDARARRIIVTTMRDLAAIGELTDADIVGPEVVPEVAETLRTLLPSLTTVRDARGRR